MIFGADVAHPGPGASRPSIASVVFSWDRAAARYMAYSEVQPPRLEIIQNLQAMVKKAILTFGNNAPPPSHIVFYRDGVSEGEMETVRTTEIAAIKSKAWKKSLTMRLTRLLEACQEVWNEKGVQARLPKVTFIVVVKRQVSSVVIGATTDLSQDTMRSSYRTIIGTTFLNYEHIR